MPMLCIYRYLCCLKYMYMYMYVCVHVPTHVVAYYCICTSMVQLPNEGVNSPVTPTCIHYSYIITNKHQYYETVMWYWEYVYIHTCNTYKAGCHPVAIAQVVEYRQLKSEAPVQSWVAVGFSQFSKNIPKPFHHACCMYTVHIYSVHPVRGSSVFSLLSAFGLCLTCFPLF